MNPKSNPGRRFREYSLIMADIPIDGFAHLVTVVYRHSKYHDILIFVTLCTLTTVYNIKPNNNSDKYTIETGPPKRHHFKKN